MKCGEEGGTPGPVERPKKFEMTRDLVLLLVPPYVAALRIINSFPPDRMTRLSSEEKRERKTQALRKFWKTEVWVLCDYAQYASSAYSVILGTQHWQMFSTSTY